MYSCISEKETTILSSSLLSSLLTRGVTRGKRPCTGAFVLGEEEGRRMRMRGEGRLRHCCKTTSSIQGRDTRKGLESVASPVALRSVASYEGGRRTPPRYAPLCARAPMPLTRDRRREDTKGPLCHVCANTDMIVLSVFARSGKNTRELVARAQVFSLLERGKENVYCAKDTIDAADKGVDGRAPGSGAAYHRWQGKRGQGRGGGSVRRPSALSLARP